MARIADPRFAKVHTAPQFRRQKRDKARVKIDPRFRKVLTDENFRAPRPKYDKYGRRATRDERRARDEITELYDDEAADDDDPAARLAQLERMARGEDEGDDASESSSESAAADEDDEGDDDAVDDDDDPVAAAAARAGLPPPPVTHETVDADAAVETRWLAVTEVEWSKVRALDLLVLLRSFVRPGGAVERVVVYRSDYGERMLAQDERFGPPRAIFRDAAAAAAAARDESDADDDDDDDDEDDEDDEDDDDDDNYYTHNLHIY